MRYLCGGSMDQFYEVMTEILSYNRVCVDCGSQKWVTYSDGHISEKCLDCDEPTERDSNFCNFGGYIMDQPEPKGPLPHYIEVCEPDPVDRSCSWIKFHEYKYYRKIRSAPWDGGGF